jgi:hypothetical protein
MIVPGMSNTLENVIGDGDGGKYEKQVGGLGSIQSNIHP